MNARYNRIGIDYDETRSADPFLCRRFLALLEPVKGGRYLELGSGTGNYTIALKEAGLTIKGVEPSDHMLATARSKGTAVDFIQGSAERIPLADHSIDGVIIMLSIHHWQDLEKGFQEVARVLKPNGRLVLFTSYPEQTANYWLKAYFPRMIADSAKALPAKSRILASFDHAGLQFIGEEPYAVKEDLQDFFLYHGKHHPHRYLDPGIRKGISSFSLLALQDEVNEGLLKLKKDIASGAIDDVIEAFPGDRGDYTFMVAIRPHV